MVEQILSRPTSWLALGKKAPRTPLLGVAKASQLDAPKPYTR